MIALKRMNREPVFVNAEQILLVEANPDTVLKLVTGEHVRVMESPEEIVKRVIAYRRAITQPSLEAVTAPALAGALPPVASFQEAGHGKQ